MLAVVCAIRDKSYILYTTKLKNTQNEIDFMIGSRTIINRAEIIL